MPNETKTAPSHLQKIFIVLQHHADVIAKELHLAEEHLKVSSAFKLLPKKEQKACLAQIELTRNELSHITHQINRCTHVCQSGDVEEVVKLRDEIRKEKAQVH